MTRYQPRIYFLVYTLSPSSMEHLSVREYIYTEGIIQQKLLNTLETKLSTLLCNEFP